MCTNPSCDCWHPPECAEFKTRTGCKVGEKCCFIHNVEKHRQGMEHQKDTQPDKVTTALFEKLGCIARKTEVLRDPTDGSTDVRRSVMMRSSKKSSRNHLTIRFCRFAEKMIQIRQRKGPSLDIVVDLETTAIPTPPVHDERDANWTDWCEDNARKAAWKRATELLQKLACQENNDTFYRTQFGSGATSRSGIDAEETVIYGFRRLCAHDEQRLTSRLRSTRS